MKTEFEKWFDKKCDKRMAGGCALDEAVHYLIAKLAWNAAIDKCWNIMKHYDNDTVLKMTLDELKK